MQNDNPIGNTINSKDPLFSTSLRITGKVDSKKPYFVLANAITLDFNSSGHAKDAQSLGRYGFKFGLRPVYTSRIRL